MHVLQSPQVLRQVVPPACSLFDGDISIRGLPYRTAELDARSQVLAMGEYVIR
jgi:hypothetical protein